MDHKQSKYKVREITEGLLTNMSKKKLDERAKASEFERQFKQLTVGEFYRVMSQKYGVGCVVINYLAHPQKRTLFKVASYALPTNKDLTPTDRILVAEVNPEKSIAYVRLTGITDESFLAIAPLNDPIMDEVVNVHNNDEITLFR